MNNFFYDITAYPFLKKALIAALLCSVAFGLTGPFVVKKRLSFLAGGIAHAVMGGIGCAYFLGANTTVGSIITAIIFSAILTISRGENSQNEDTTISTLWAVGMSIGIIFLYITPGYTADLSSFIFGNILMVKAIDLWIIAALDLVIIAVTTMFYYHFVYISFDENFLESRGIGVKLIYFTLLAMISITVVITIKIVGLILVMALITLPAVISSLFTRTMKMLIVTAVLCGIVLTFAGIGIAYVFNLPAGACIILLASFLYFIALATQKIAHK